ncbi:hypothetical protein GW17_00040090 [Ensete ventricosum]|nr:hypothetical protein GW17_00040090 [Ensete ventricosum]
METPLVAEPLRIPGLVARLLSDLAGAWASLALLVAGFAAFLSVLARAKLAFLRYGRAISSTSPPACYCSSGEDDDSDSDSPSDDDEEEEDEAPSSSSDEYESTPGSYWDDRGRDGGLDLALGGAVVRTWEGLGLGFDRAGGLISLMDLDRGEVLRSFHAEAPAAAASLATPAVVVSAGEGAGAGGAAVTVWDARSAGQLTPAAAAEWWPILRRRVVGVAGADGRVYVGDDGGVITAADLRRGRSPLVVETWRQKKQRGCKKVATSHQRTSVVGADGTTLDGTSIDRSDDEKARFSESQPHGRQGSFCPLVNLFYAFTACDFGDASAVVSTVVFNHTGFK